MSRRPLATCAVAAALLAGLPLVSGCAAGKEATTATERTISEGGNSNLGYLQVRNAYLAPPAGGSYSVGSTVPMSVSLVNSGDNADSLTAVTASGAASVALTATPPAGAASGSASPAPDATTAAAPTLPLTVPPHMSVQLQATSGGSYLELRGLTRKLLEAQYVTVTLTFRVAGDTTLQVPVSTGEYTAAEQ